MGALFVVTLLVVALPPFRDSAPVSLPVVGHHEQSPFSTWSFSVSKNSTSTTVEIGTGFRVTGSTSLVSGTAQSVTLSVTPLANQSACWVGSENYAQGRTGTPNPTYYWGVGLVPSSGACLMTYGFVFQWTSSGAASYSFTYWLAVKAGPSIASASATPTSGWAPLTVTFAASATGGTAPYTYSWVFGDGGTSTSQNPVYTFGQPGSYSPTVTVTDAVGVQASAYQLSVDSKFSNLSVSLSPAAVATVAGTPVAFHATPSGGQAPYNYSWVILNFTTHTSTQGATTPSSNLTFTPSVPGTWGVFVIINDSLGASNRALYTNVTAVAAPTLAAVADTPFTNVTTHSTVQFFGSAAGGVSPYTFSWNFDDGAKNATAQDPTHQFNVSGPRGVTFTVSDSAHHSATAWVNLTVSAPPPLNASIREELEGYAAPLTVAFQGVASGGLSPYTYTWTFGDGASASGPRPTHNYTLSGTYKVHLTVRDKAGSVSRTTSSVIAVATGASLTPHLTASAVWGTLPLRVHLVGWTTGGSGATTLTWTTGLAGRSHAASLNVTYRAAGIYLIELAATDTSGTNVGAYLNVSVTATKLTALLNQTQTAGPAPWALALQATLKGGLAPYQYAWTFGDGTPGSTVTAPSHTYLVPGLYTVTLEVTDSLGFTVTSSSSVQVYAVSNLAASASVLVYDNSTGNPLGGANVTATTNASGAPPLSGISNGAGQTYFGGLVPGAEYWLNVSDTGYSNYTGSGSQVVGGLTLGSTVHLRELPGPLQVHASVSSWQVTSPATVQFGATTMGGVAPYTFAWQFGDGGTSPAQAPTHSYTQQGVFRATVVATDSASHSASSSVDVTVLPGVSPVQSPAASSLAEMTVAVLPASPTGQGTYSATGPWTAEAVALDGTGLPIAGTPVTFQLPTDATVVGGSPTTNSLGAASVTFTVPASSGGSGLVGALLSSGPTVTTTLPANLAVSTLGNGQWLLPSTVSSSVMTPSGFQLINPTNACSSPFTSSSIVTADCSGSQSGNNLLSVSCDAYNVVSTSVGVTSCAALGLAGLSLLSCPEDLGLGCAAAISIGSAYGLDNCPQWLIGALGQYVLQLAPLANDALGESLFPAQDLQDAGVSTAGEICDALSPSANGPMLGGDPRGMSGLPEASESPAHQGTAHPGAVAHRLVQASHAMSSGGTDLPAKGEIAMTAVPTRTRGASSR